MSKWIQQGEAISGKYCGVEFSGTVTSSRAHSISGEQILNIDLDAPITVYGTIRNQINECEISAIEMATSAEVGVVADMHEKGAVLTVWCSHEECEQFVVVPLPEGDDFDRIDCPPEGFARLAVSAYFPGYDSGDARIFYYCEQHFKEVLPSFYNKYIAD